MKIIAYYLPQFHEIEENNLWWGKGFTEWTNLKKAHPLYKNHKQPVVPLDGYYNLLDPDTMKRQAEYAKDYGIYGMAFYHYWFDGKMLLEKPAEMLLRNKDIDMKYMFFWANHDWIKSWDGTKKLLQKQVYGGKKDWDAHFAYLRNFFDDERYIKIDNRPAIGIFMISAIPDVNEMIERWNVLAKECGFDGVYVIESALKMSEGHDKFKTDAVVLRQPNIGMFRYCRVYNISKRIKELQPIIPGCYPLILSYKKVMENLIKNSKNYKNSKTIMLGYFTGWDNTSRHGKRGSVIEGKNPELFRSYFSKLLKIAEERNIEFIFINAWNEWCEGMFLEPDDETKFEYLQAIKEVLNEKNR